MEEFVVKRTDELTQSEIEQINSLFNEVFDRQRSVNEFENQCVQNPFGYAYHSLFICDGIIVGHNSGVPSYYVTNGEKIKVICNIDTMIHKKHRGIENYYEIMNNAYDRYKEDGFAMAIGFPNDNAHPLITQMKFLLDVGKLSIYFLPYRIGGVKKKFEFLNLFSKIFCILWVNLSLIFASKNKYVYSIEKEASSFNETRYKCMDGIYEHIINDDLEFYYKIKIHEGVRTAFLVDVINKSSYSFCMAVKYILKHESQNFDLMLYVGDIPSQSLGLIKIPRKMEPKNFFLTAKIFNKDVLSKDLVYDISNWDINLSNYDLI